MGWDEQDGGGRCGQYQSSNRNKNMLQVSACDFGGESSQCSSVRLPQDLYKACKETGFFFIHNTNIDEFTVKRVRAPHSPA